MTNLQICKYLIGVNRELIQETAMSDCHCIGLNSFIINRIPKIRLFIAEPHCELFGEYDHLDPIIPIHGHKYDDIFLQIEGKMINHLYSVGGGIEFNKWGYGRLSDGQKGPQLIGKSYLEYLGPKDDVTWLKSTELHTASLSGERCSWMIIETSEDKNFEQVAYHKNLIGRPELYKPMSDPNLYLDRYFRGL